MPLTQIFVSISDPRSARQVRHDLSELLTVAVCAVLCSADEFSDIEAWAKERIDWLRDFLVLEHGIPSHDTFGRVFAALNPREFEAAFRSWVGQLIPDEITAIPELLATLALNGCVVTIDAMGTQTGIAKAIRGGGADYVLCVKDNHPKLVESFLLAQAGVGGTLTPNSTTESREEGHGRTEVRRCWAFDAVDHLYKAEQWADLKSFAIVERERTIGTKTRCERRYYISSLPADAKRIAHAVRSHWEVENRLHWCLDVQFGEDQSTVRTGYAANNLAIVRHIVMNLLRLNTSRKGSIKTKRMLAATSDTFRAELLGFMT